MKTDFFPKPSDLVQDTPTQHVINILRNKILNHDFSFQPEYQHKKYFSVARMFLIDHNWNLTIGEKGEWIINPII